MKKVILIGIFVFIGVGVAYNYYVNTPKYILGQISESLYEHDWEKFNEYVDPELGTKLLSEEKTEQEKYKARLVKLVLDKKWIKDLSLKYYGDRTNIEYVKDHNNIITVGLKSFFTRYDTAVIAEFDILRPDNKLIAFNNLNSYINSVDSLENIRIDTLNKYLKTALNELLQFDYKIKILKQDFLSTTSEVRVIAHNNTKDTIIEYKVKVKMYDSDIGLFYKIIHEERYNAPDTTLWYNRYGNLEKTEIDTFENVNIPPKQIMDNRSFELKNNIYTPTKIKYQVLYVKFSDGAILKYPLQPYEDLFNENLKRGIEKYIIPMLRKGTAKIKKRKKNQKA